MERAPGLLRSAPWKRSPHSTFSRNADHAIQEAFDLARREIAAAYSDGTAWDRAAARAEKLRPLFGRDLPPFPIADLTPLRGMRRLAAPAARPDALVDRTAESPLPLRTVEETLARHPFLDWHEGSNELRVRRGIWSVDGSMILPPRVGLRIPAGTVLRFAPRAGLIARGPLHFDGSLEAPIVLEGPPGSRRSQLWAGVFVVESAARSEWKHVVVRNTGGFRRGSWTLPGGVVFRQTRVDLESCSLQTSLADDALNLIRSSFRLRDVDVSNAASDAIDFDYSEGSVERGTISFAAGDGLDLGGSRATLRDVHLTEIDDKAISVGERSELSADRIRVVRTSIGIASKNSSQAAIRDSVFDNVSLVGLIAYRNRAEYEPGVIVSNGNEFRRTTRVALAETGSRIVVDGAETRVEDVSIASVGAVAAAE